MTANDQQNGKSALKQVEQGETPFKAGYVAIVGRPNVGKSTLMNTLLDRKLAIVTPKPQTTRHQILGILSGDNHQVILLDTPGLMHPQYMLQEAMMQTARKTMQQADLILMMADATDPIEQHEEIVGLLKKHTQPKFLVINKIDLMDKFQILPLMDRFSQTGLFREIIPVSALRADNLDRLLSCILDALPSGEPCYPPDVISNEPERFFVSEIIREQIFLRYAEEIPYSTTVRIDAFEERSQGKDYIEATIVVERDSQKGILIGRGGQAIKRTGQIARQSIEEFIQRPVFLKLNVRVKKKWRKDEELVKRFGY